MTHNNWMHGYLRLKRENHTLKHTIEELEEAISLLKQGT